MTCQTDYSWLQSTHAVISHTTRKSGASTRATAAPKPAVPAVIKATFCADMMERRMAQRVPETLQRRCLDGSDQKEVKVCRSISLDNNVISPAT